MQIAKPTADPVRCLFRFSAFGAGKSLITASLRARCLFSCLLVLGPAASGLRGDPPLITGLSPRGAERGKSVVLVVEGANLSENAELILGLSGAAVLKKSAPLEPAPNRVAYDLLVSELDAPGP